MPPGGVHVQREEFPWGVRLPAPGRGRRDMDETCRIAFGAAATIPGFAYGPPPWSCHRGGGLWVKDETGFFLLRNLAEVSWAAQFAADPARIDALRRNARTVYSAFSESVPALAALGGGDADEIAARAARLQKLLDTPIRSAAAVSAWVDSIFNASVPLPEALHDGVLPAGSGVEHYPQPVVDIMFFKRPDFQLWVTDPGSGRSVAVLPTGPVDASGVSDVQVIYAPQGTQLGDAQALAASQGNELVVPASHPLAQAAFAVRLGLQDQANSLNSLQAGEFMASAAGPSGTQEGGAGWSINVPNHAPRADSLDFMRARTVANRLARESPGFFYGQPPYQVHHGGGLWVYENDDPEKGKPVLVRNLFGMTWSSQFCADPARVDVARQTARRLYARFPRSAAALDLRTLLDTPITDAAGVATWTDSLCNASIPLTPEMHMGVIPRGSGIHHYPARVAQIPHFLRAGLNIWATDPGSGRHVAVIPTGLPDSPDGRVALFYAPADTEMGRQGREARAENRWLVLGRAHPISREARGRSRDRGVEGDGLS
jgi:hypothetical protein